MGAAWGWWPESRGGVVSGGDFCPMLSISEAIQ